jgi:hypothetical protein
MNDRAPLWTSLIVDFEMKQNYTFSTFFQFYNKKTVVDPEPDPH